MIHDLRKTETEYIKCFSNFCEDEKIIRYWDDLLPDMYCHNFTYIKDNVPENELYSVICRELSIRRQGSKSFMQIEADFPIGKGHISSLSIVPEISRQLFMTISPEKYSVLKGNESCIIKEASVPEVMEDTIKLDIELSTPTMGGDFARRRILRKAAVYSSADNSLEGFVCYNNGIPVGNCELFIDGDTAKIEDFSVLEEYQRRGFGTSILKHLLEKCVQAGVKTAYVVTDADDTAKDMYTKCGFRAEGEKTIVFALI